MYLYKLTTHRIRLGAGVGLTFYPPVSRLTNYSALHSTVTTFLRHKFVSSSTSIICPSCISGLLTQYSQLNSVSEKIKCVPSKKSVCWDLLIDMYVCTFVYLTYLVQLLHTF